jgi:glycosyltransferase involved in cell wall biosynthesis
VWESQELARRFPLIEAALIRAEGAIAHAPDHADEIRASWGGPVAELFLPTYPTDWVKRKPSAADRSDERLVLMTVGHVNRNKHIDVLIELIGMRPDIALRVRYVVVGPYDERGEYFRHLRELIDRYGLDETVMLLDYQSDEVLAHWMARTDIFINLRHPNLEGGSASLMRQLPWGRPVVVYDSGVFATLPDDAAVKVRPCDRDDLELSLRRLVDDAQARRRIGAAGRKWARSMSVTVYVERFLAFIDNEVRRFRPLLALADRAAAGLASMGAAPSLPVVDRVARELAELTPEVR